MKMDPLAAVALFGGIGLTIGVVGSTRIDCLEKNGARAFWDRFVEVATYIASGPRQE